MITIPPVLWRIPSSVPATGSWMLQTETRNGHADRGVVYTGKHNKSIRTHLDRFSKGTLHGLQFRKLVKHVCIPCVHITHLSTDFLLLSNQVFCCQPCDTIGQDFELPVQITASPVQTLSCVRSLEEELQEAIQKAQVRICR